jgi:hypothetical protein
MKRFSNDEDAIELPLHWGAFRVREYTGAINAHVGVDATLDADP